MSGKKKENVGVSGNVLASGALVEKALMRTGLAIHQIQSHFNEQEAFDVYLRGIRLGTKHGSDGEWLAVVAIDTPDGPQVAFHAADTFPSCVEGLWNRIRNDSLRWRTDEYAQQK